MDYLMGYGGALAFGLLVILVTAGLVYFVMWCLAI